MAAYIETNQEETTTPETQTVRTTQQYIPTEQPVGEAPERVYQKKKAIFRTYQVVWYILGVIEVLLAFRLVFKLLGANPQSGFAAFVYAISDPLALPFAGILRATRTAGSLLEWSTIIAMVVYAVIAWGLVKLLKIVKPTNPAEVEQTVDSQ